MARMLRIQQQPTTHRFMTYAPQIYPTRIIRGSLSLLWMPNHLKVELFQSKRVFQCFHLIESMALK